MRRVLPIFLALFVALPLCAQQARDILDRTAAKLHAMPAAEARFEIGTFKGATPISQTIKGKMLVQKEKLYVETPEMLTWYDGKTQWSILKGSNEVNVSTPSEEELQQMNPYSFIGIYKKGFRLSSSDADYHGTPAHEVRMLPNSKKGYNGIYEARITIDKKSFLPLSVRFRTKKNTWTRIRISNLKEKRGITDAHFRFNAKEHPGMELIDLR